MHLLTLSFFYSIPNYTGDQAKHACGYVAASASPLRPAPLLRSNPNKGGGHFLMNEPYYHHQHQEKGEEEDGIILSTAQLDCRLLPGELVVAHVKSK